MVDRNLNPFPRHLKSINCMDQAITLFFNGSNSLYIDGVVFLATQTFTWILLMATLLYVLFREHDFKHFGILLGLTILLIVVADQVASSIFKPWVARFRPTQDPYIMHILDVVRGYRGGTYGFFSSHASNTFAIATFFSLLYRQREVVFSLMAWATLNGFTRIYLGVHYFGDVLVGSIFGIFLAFSVYKLYRRWCADSEDFLYSERNLRLIPISIWLTLIFISIPWKLVF